MATYDSAEIRRAAHVVRSSRDRLNASVLSGLRSVEGELDGEFKGQAAEALEKRLGNLTADARRIEDKLDVLYRTLMKFAQDLDDTDREIASKL